MDQRPRGMPAGRDADSFYVDDCRQVQTNTHKIQTLTGQISRLIAQMTCDKDFERCRSMVDDAVKQASETKVLLQRIQQHQHQAQTGVEKTNRRMMYQKLSDNLAVTARVLEDVVRRYTVEEKKTIAALNASSSSGAGRRPPPPGVDPLGVAARPGDGGLAEAEGITVHRMDADDEEGGSSQIAHPLIGGPSSSAAEEAFLEEHAELKRERVVAAQRVDEDMRCLQKIYTDLATAAEEQQSNFDTMESSIASASIDVERGLEQIEYGRNTWDRRMKRRMWTYGSIVLVVLAMIWFWS